MAGHSKDLELERISMELNKLSFKKEQLIDRRNVLTVLHEFKNQMNCASTERSLDDQVEIDCINGELRELEEMKKELQECYDMHQPKQKKDDNCIGWNGVSVLPHRPEPFMIFIEAPPTIPAPKVILDITKLPPFPSQTQCPECRQFVTTETNFSIGNVACLACVLLATIGCLAGCCLLPFYFKTCKDVTHKCPKCRSCIYKITKL